MLQHSHARYLDLVMPFNLTREALIKDKICEMSYEKAVGIGLDMKRDEADLDKLLDTVLKIYLREEQENLTKVSALQAETRKLDEIFNEILNQLYENVTAIGFEINIDDVPTDLNIRNNKYNDINETQAVLEIAYEKARGIIEDKVWENALKTVSKDINAAQVIGTITDNVKKIHGINIIFLIAAITGQIAVVVISIIGAQKNKICIDVMMGSYALGILFYIFFLLAGMSFLNLNTSFPMVIPSVGITTITITGEITKYLLLDLLLRIIALIALYKFKRVKYDTYGIE